VTEPQAALGYDEIVARVGTISWHHPIDLGRGIVTPGHSSRTVPPEAVPDLQGRSVLDIGAWDGLYSFDAESRGAVRVAALDHYVWGVDMYGRDRYWEECARQGIVPDPGADETRFWRPELPGKAGFDLAHSVLGSRVEAVVDDFMTMDLDKLGVFDVVFYFGVLYHMREPLTALRRVRAVTGQVMVLETEAVVVPGHEDEPLVLFYAGGELSNDHTNWYVPSLAGVKGLCRAAGFRRLDVQLGPPAIPRRSRLDQLRGRRVSPLHYRLVLQAFPE
jgi:tRNA (mo5U34)-methyltransferase